MRIDSTGKVIIGVANLFAGGSPYFNEGITLHPGSDSIFHRDGGSVVDFSRETSDGQIVRFLKDNSVVGSIASRGGVTTSFVGYPSSGNGAGVAASTNMIIPSNETGAAQDNRINLGSNSTRWKDLYLSGGVYLGGTGSANKLDDYEEGTFNVVVGGSSGSGTSTYTNQTGRYTKIGSLVHCSGYITVSSIGAVSGTYAQIQNLPFTVGSVAPYGNGNYSGGVLSYWNNFNVNSAGFTLYPDTASTSAYVLYRSSFGTSIQYMSPQGWGSQPAFMFGLTYTTDS
jgi:hypothetical protein